MIMGRGRRIAVGVLIGAALTAGGLAAGTSPAHASDHGVDQVDNGNGTCTTTVAGWVSYPNDTCNARLPQPVRKVAATATIGAATGGWLGGAEAAWAAGITTILGALPW